ncbi:conserved hypothetical protein [uncultured Paludibacter sp.]|uniref:Uncharacterized protein n=1 Tax=uncultured Paludibacter sp. TaxID=497635 RepID=A0A653AD76_9BACT|nr:conserved hypothetical protein [uncultured Paludibacter sp.]
MKTDIEKSQYFKALSRIEELLPLVSYETSTNDPNSVELCLMSDIVEKYKKFHYPI